jgi:hypothetical protein
MFANQSGNSAGGNVVGGDSNDNSVTNIYHVTQGSAVSLELAALYAKLKADGVGDPSGGVFSEKLDHWMSAVTEGDVRGLEAKLRESGREDLLLLALNLKQKASMAIMKRQTSRTAQRIYTILLSQLHTKFNWLVTPVIQEGGSRAEVDQRVHTVLQEVANLLGENALEIDSDDIEGLLFFLAGNCHIRWDKC